MYLITLGAYVEIVYCCFIVIARSLNKPFCILREFYLYFGFNTTYKLKVYRCEIPQCRLITRNNLNIRHKRYTLKSSTASYLSAELEIQSYWTVEAGEKSDTYNYIYLTLAQMQFCIFWGAFILIPAMFCGSRSAQPELILLRDLT